VGGLSGDITYDHHKFSDITIMWYHIMVISCEDTWYHLCYHVWYWFYRSLGHVISSKKHDFIGYIMQKSQYHMTQRTVKSMSHMISYMISCMISHII
jgi:hypothetical protein